MYYSIIIVLFYVLGVFFVYCIIYFYVPNTNANTSRININASSN